MRLVRLVQGTPGWHVWRSHGIGGSDAAAVLGLSPWCTPLLLWQRRTGRAPEEAVNWAMRRGQRLEPVARRAYQELTGTRVPPACVQHDAHPEWRVSLDGFDLAGELLVEIKAPNGVAHRHALEGSLPDYYRPQVQWQLLVTGLPHAHYVSWSDAGEFGDGERLAVVEVAPDPALQALLEVYAARWWRCVREDRPPDWTTVAGAVPGQVPEVERPRRRRKEVAT